MRQANSCRLFTSEYVKQGSTANESSKASSEEKTDDELQISTKIIGLYADQPLTGFLDGEEINIIVNHWPSRLAENQVRFVRPQEH
jgi:hypothetical protein